MRRSHVRSDYALRLLLGKIVEHGLSDHVRNLVEHAQRHMGHHSPYRGGRTLTDLLRQAHAGARVDDDHDTAERLEDALSYATNAMLAPDLEITSASRQPLRPRQKRSPTWYCCEHDAGRFGNSLPSPSTGTAASATCNEQWRGISGYSVGRSWRTDSGHGGSAGASSWI